MSADYTTRAVAWNRKRNRESMHEKGK